MCKKISKIDRRTKAYRDRKKHLLQQRATPLITRLLNKYTRKAFLPTLLGMLDAKGFETYRYRKD